MLQNILDSIDIMTVLTALWTAVIIPVIAQLDKYIKSKKLDKYTAILYSEVSNAVKAVYEAEVKLIKGTDEWTEETQAEIREIAKTKAIQGLTNTVYSCLKESNTDFESYLDSLIDTVLYDLKNNK